MPLFFRSRESATDPSRAGAKPRVLFLDDDSARAAVFLTENPEAVWVQTVAECLARLEEPWDEVHLDHDLGGEQFVDCDRPDCGMEVVRRLCLRPRGCLRDARFRVQTHNLAAATVMEERLTSSGYAVEVRPFGDRQGPPAPRVLAASEPRIPLPPPPPPSRLARLGRWALGLVGLATPDPGSDVPAFLPIRADMKLLPPGPGRDPERPLERLDLSWASPLSSRPATAPETRPTA